MRRRKATASGRSSFASSRKFRRSAIHSSRSSATRAGGQRISAGLRGQHRLPAASNDRAQELERYPAKSSRFLKSPWPDLIRPSTSLFFLPVNKELDPRVKPAGGPFWCARTRSDSALEFAQILAQRRPGVFGAHQTAALQRRHQAFANFVDLAAADALERRADQIAVAADRLHRGAHALGDL